MKTIILPSAHSVAKVIVLQVALACCLALQTVSAQSATLVSQPVNTANFQAEKLTMGFQSAAFPVGKQNTIKVIFEDPTGNGAVIHIRNANGEIIFTKHCSKKKSYMGNFDLSVLPDDTYRVEVVALTKAEFNKHTYAYTFQMQTESQRSIKLWNKEVEKELFTPRPYQVRR